MQSKDNEIGVKSMATPEVILLTRHDDWIGEELAGVIGSLNPEAEPPQIEQDDLYDVVTSPTSDQLVVVKAGEIIGAATVNKVSTLKGPKTWLDDYVLLDRVSRL